MSDPEGPSVPAPPPIQLNPTQVSAGVGEGRGQSAPRRPAVPALPPSSARRPEVPQAVTKVVSAEVSAEVSAYELSLGVLKPSQILANRYRIEAQIGQGGMGKVYRAEDLNLMRTVVIKVAHSEAMESEKELARFKREAHKMASLSHPNIVSIYDYGEQDEVQYLVMELVDGAMIKQELRDGGPFEPERFFEVIIQLLSGLSAAHKQQVIHRDIKPSNLMWDERSELLKVLDFGLARGVEGDTLTGTGHVHGSIQYMAPEQIRGDSQDERTDIYAVGVLSYQLLTGQLPFTGENTVELMFQKLQYRPKPLVELLPQGSWVTEELSTLISQCLEIEPSQRLRDASECLIQFKRARANMSSADQPAQGHELEVMFPDEPEMSLDDHATVALLQSLIKRPSALITLASLLGCCVALTYVLVSLSGPPPSGSRKKIELNTSEVTQPLKGRAALPREQLKEERPPPSSSAGEPILLPPRKTELLPAQQAAQARGGQLKDDAPKKLDRPNTAVGKRPPLPRAQRAVIKSSPKPSKRPSKPPSAKATKADDVDVPLLDFP